MKVNKTQRKMENHIETDLTHDGRKNGNQGCRISLQSFRG
jgi:hypothetical protein